MVTLLDQIKVLEEHNTDISYWNTRGLTHSIREHLYLSMSIKFCVLSLDNLQCFLYFHLLRIGRVPDELWFQIGIHCCQSVLA